MHVCARCHVCLFRCCPLGVFAFVMFVCVVVLVVRVLLSFLFGVLAHCTLGVSCCSLVGVFCWCS